jgi:hypothetical protein
VQQANAWLKDGLRPRRTVGLYSNADGTGTAATPAEARYKAISEALERWAYDGTIGRDDSAQYGFKVDPTSSGMAAFPGLVADSARNAARHEAIERGCLIAWSSGLITSRRRETGWEGIGAVEIPSPVGGVCVIVFRQNDAGFYSYGHAGGETFTAACRRAIVELGRNEQVLIRMRTGTTQPANLFERRCVFFSSPEGFESFQRRIGAGTSSQWQARKLVDAEIPGPWSQYATVWRVLFQPATDRYLSNELDVFVW